MLRLYPSVSYKFCCMFCVAAMLLFPVGIAAQEKGGINEPAGLPEELKEMTISDAFIPLFAEAVGSIQSVKGRLVVRHGDVFRAYYAAPGNQLYEKDILYTLDESRSRLKFVTDEVITMGANSRISVDQVVDNRQAQEKRSIFSMLKGKAMFYALRLFRYKKVDVEVRTPTAVAGIRGTKFGIEVIKTESRQASAGAVYLADASGRLPAGLLAQNTPEEESQTIVYGFDGEVQVTSTTDGSTQTVGAGENVTVGPEGSGEVATTSPDAAQQFSGETDAPAGETGGGEGTGESGTGGTETGEGGDTQTGETSVDTTASNAETGASDFNQNQTTQTIQESVVSGTRVGYFSALLTRYDRGLALADVYTNSSRANFEGGEVSGKSIVDPTGFATATGTQEEADTYIKQIKTIAGGPFDSGDLGTTRRMDNDTNTPGWPSEDQLGSNAYMDWGFWRMSSWVPGVGIVPTYAITDRAYYVGGEVTPDAAAAGIVGSYAGPAWGTYFSGNGGYDMIGAFNCDVNVPAKTVTNFNLTVSGVEGPTASIVNGSGAFVGSSSEFKLNGGTWMLNGATPAAKSLSGSLYGPAGEHIGGAWAMDKGVNNEAAVGIFVGDQGGTATPPAAYPPAIPSPPPP